MLRTYSKTLSRYNCWVGWFFMTSWHPMPNINIVYKNLGSTVNCCSYNWNQATDFICCLLADLTTRDKSDKVSNLERWFFSVQGIYLDKEKVIGPGATDNNMCIWTTCLVGTGFCCCCCCCCFCAVFFAYSAF